MGKGTGDTRRGGEPAESEFGWGDEIFGKLTAGWRL